jgi:hypothetical protein
MTGMLFQYHFSSFFIYYSISLLLHKLLIFLLADFLLSILNVAIRLPKGSAFLLRTEFLEEVQCRPINYSKKCKGV